MGIDSVGIHVETFDPQVLARVAPGKARWGIEAYFTAWERAVAAFGAGQVSTYVILGMGEDQELTVEGCKRAIDIGVYPFVVPVATDSGQPDAGPAPAIQRGCRGGLPADRCLQPGAQGHVGVGCRGGLRALPGVLGPGCL